MSICQTPSRTPILTEYRSFLVLVLPGLLGIDAKQEPQMASLEARTHPSAAFISSINRPQRKAAEAPGGDMFIVCPGSAKEQKGLERTCNPSSPGAEVGRF